MCKFETESGTSRCWGGGGGGGGGRGGRCCGTRGTCVRALVAAVRSAAVRTLVAVVEGTAAFAVVGTPLAIAAAEPAFEPAVVLVAGGLWGAGIAAAAEAAAGPAAAELAAGRPLAPWAPWVRLPAGGPSCANNHRGGWRAGVAFFVQLCERQQPTRWAETSADQRDQKTPVVGVRVACMCVRARDGVPIQMVTGASRSFLNGGGGRSGSCRASVRGKRQESLTASS